MEFTKINIISRCEDYLPTKKLSELEVDKVYRVTDIKSVKAKYGKTIIVSIDNAFSVFLPSRIVTILLDNQKDLEDMMNAANENHLGLRFLGGKYNQFEFLTI